MTGSATVSHEIVERRTARLQEFRGGRTAAHARPVALRLGIANPKTGAKPEGRQ